MGGTVNLSYCVFLNDETGFEEDFPIVPDLQVGDIFRINDGELEGVHHITLIDDRIDTLPKVCFIRVFHFEKEEVTEEEAEATVKSSGLELIDEPSLHTSGSR